jgi:hypothetical protein
LTSRIFVADCGSYAIERIERPVDLEGGVVPEDGAFAGGEIRICSLIEDFCGIREHEEAVGKSLRNPEKFEIACFVVRLEVEGCPFAEVRGIPAKIYSDVPDMTGENTDKFTLRFAKLIMKAPEHPFD